MSDEGTVVKEGETVMYERKNGAAKWIAIVGFIGMATGVMIGLMYAPKEGKVTRRYVQERAGRMGRQVKDAYGRARARISRKDETETSSVAS